MINGQLNLVIGPMYSGKTTELIKIFNKYNKNNNVLILNHKADNRYGINSVNTHNKKNLPCISLDNLYNYYDEFKIKHNNIDIILIDEAQFFQDLYNFCKDIVEKFNKIVYVFGLSGDYKRNKFGKILDLIPIADNIKLLKSKCNNCNNLKEAPFTMRIINSKEQILIGSNNEYISVCRDCWNKNIIK